MQIKLLSQLLLVAGVAAEVEYQLPTVQKNQSPLVLGLSETPEIRDPILLQNVGKIPSWVKGSLYRGGFGTWDVGNWTADHWFDGMSRTHRFEIENGAVHYRSRNASDELVDFIQEHGLYPGGSFAGDPCKATFGEFEVKFRDGNEIRGDTENSAVEVSFVTNFPGLAANTSNHGPFVTLVRTTDGNNLLQIDPVTLDPIELFTYNASNPNFGGGRTAAHAARDPDGTLYNYLSDGSNQYSVIKIDKNGVGSVLANITAPLAYIHAMFSTEHYAILLVWQADIDTSHQQPNLADSFKPWNATRETEIYVVDKIKGGVVAKYKAPAFFAFHEINSYEDPKTKSIIIDMPVMKDYEFINGARFPNFRDYIGKPNTTEHAKHDIPSTFTRWRLPNYANAPRDKNGAVTFQKTIKEFEIPHKIGNIELPRINSAYESKAYRYAYGVHIEKPGYFTDSIVKIDVEKRTAKVWSPKVDGMPSEPVFVPRPGGKDEDDGVLLIVNFDTKLLKSALVVLDAKNMKELGRAQMPIPVSFGFHGVWGAMA